MDGNAGTHNRSWKGSGILGYTFDISNICAWHAYGWPGDL